MMHNEFHHILSSLEGLSQEQLRQLRRELDDHFAVRRPRDTTAESVFILMDRAGLVGCLPGTPHTPRDLATNPEHMQGFGGA
jgi:hypothetical protein